MLTSRKMNKFIGMLMFIKAERTIICTARIMPHISCIEPPKISISKKLPPLNVSMASDAASALSSMSFASSLSAMIGGRAPPIYGTPPLNESVLIDFIVAWLLNIDTSLTSIATPASPETDKFSG